MAWEFAAIVAKKWANASVIHSTSRDWESKIRKWVLVSPGESPNPPRFQGVYILDGGKTQKIWTSPINKPYWAFTDDDDQKFEKAAKEAKMRVTTEFSIEGDSRKIHFESSDLLSLINEAGKEGWEIAGGIGSFLGGPRETKFRIMRREI